MRARCNRIARLGWTRHARCVVIGRRFSAEAIQGHCFASLAITDIESDGYFPVVIPGRPEGEPGIHTHDGGYGFRARAASRHVPE
ncbi:hypothetical protein BRAS3843_940034 [Bradyrhizobium sp. STM 3843]|nr:hypothetical protein BRAS3843_940034 [Bradyrhizobium sp. STM 3843]